MAKTPVKIFQEKELSVLRGTAKPVALKEIGKRKIKKIIADMKRALASQEDGVAIAAPQIGVPMRIFVVSGKVKAIILKEDETKTKYPDEVFINPKIVRSSKEKQIMEEGCLSVRWLYGKVKRANKVKMEAFDERGRKVRRGASGLLAQVFQHEIDHLDGKLFTDTAKDLHKWMPKTKGIRKELKSQK
ncbi:MAG TPA: peptide deformylase [Candidatus Paceibacterota bacterium]